MACPSGAKPARLPGASRCLPTWAHLPLPHPLQISVNSSALATDGSGRAAAVTVASGNKIRVKKGVATIRDIAVAADEPGTYALRVQSASRKVAVQDAVLQLAMAPQNVVGDLQVLLPEGLESGECVAGTSAQLHVAVLTENGAGLPSAVAAGSLALKVTPPGGQGLQEGSHMLPVANSGSCSAFPACPAHPQPHPPRFRARRRRPLQCCHVLPGC